MAFQGSTGDEAIQNVLKHPENYVLKPQLEGGGNLYNITYIMNKLGKRSLSRCSVCGQVLIVGIWYCAVINQFWIMQVYICVWVCSVFCNLDWYSTLYRLRILGNIRQ